MKKRDLLFAGLILFAAAPAVAQTEPDYENRDGKQIFFQGFEQDWDAWSTEVIDTINGMWYYSREKCR